MAQKNWHRPVSQKTRTTKEELLREKRDLQVPGIGHVCYNGVHYWVQEFGTTSNTTETTANDSVVTVKINVDSRKITAAAVAVSPTTLELDMGDSVDLLTVTVGLQLEKAWPARESPVTVMPGWSVSPAETTEVSGGKLTAKAASTVTLNQESFSYTGMAHTLDVPVVLDGATLTKGTDYSLTYQNHINGC